MGAIKQAVVNIILQILGSVQVIIDLVGVVAITAVTASGELLDDLTTYKQYEIDWLHVAKVMMPFVAKDVLAYVYHRRKVADALATEPPKP